MAKKKEKNLSNDTDENWLCCRLCVTLSVVTLLCVVTLGCLFTNKLFVFCVVVFLPHLMLMHGEVICYKLMDCGVVVSPAVSLQEGV